MSITVNCNVSWGDNAGEGAIHFTHEDIPIVLYFSSLSDVGDPNSMKSVNLHVNDDRTICTLYDLYDYFRRDGWFNLEMTREHGQYREESRELNHRIKTELANAELKLTAPTEILMTIINEAGSMEMQIFRTKCPQDWQEYTQHYAAALRSETNQIVKCRVKMHAMFPIAGRIYAIEGRGGSRSRRLIRSRRKANRVKRPKSMKRYNKRRYKRV